MSAPRTIAAVGVLAITSVWATDSVVIAPGDTLSELAGRHDVSVAELVAWNEIADPDLIIAGADLRIAPPQEISRPEQYTVVAGDTVSAIARLFGVSIDDVATWNELVDPDLIVAGRSLRLAPPAGSAPPPSPTSPAPPADEPEANEAGESTSTGRTYVIRAGDTLGAIARQHGVTTSELIIANQLTDADRIIAGRTLVIPGPASAPASPPPTTSAPVPAETTTTTVPSTTSIPQPSQGASTALSAFFERWSAAYGVPRSLVEAVAWKESSWRAETVGPDGHLGIGQLSPDTIAFVEERLLGLDLEPLDASNGIQLMSRYLRYLLDRTDNEREAVAAYHQGLASVQGSGVSSAGNAFADDVFAIRDQRS